MALFTPPSEDKDGRDRSGGGDKASGVVRTPFHLRPSLGLALWGPLVPASDNRAGLWTLVGLQTLMGAFFVSRFRALRPKLLKRDIADFPSLNRFSKTSGDMHVGPVHVFADFGGTHSFHRRAGESPGFFQSRRFVSLKRALYLSTGVVLLVQSALESARLTLLVYDPWEEQARGVRDKQFYNDVVRYYHEGVDPARFIVKDPASGNTLPVNVPEVKQGVALARAHTNARNIITRWLGPLDCKPLSSSEFLDKLEHYLDTCDFIQDMNNKRLFGNPAEVKARQKALDALIQANKENRRRIRHILDITPPRGLPLSPKAVDQGLRSIILDPDHESTEDLDLHELWSIYNPWVDLALDTSLSIKFLPTVRTPEELLGDSEDTAVEQKNPPVQIKRERG
ncbi:AFR719Wp [Eremothecium gossypii ATCC 10895]|uniref:Mitochondrial inner membrane i-AAA protease complex subunit MGR1 n=1 Tax=Eremothecium gossypii (strain ATCC 10895 / CBS 109.51 / FGSC 9923 / NRRL Y-1056) TaxID=284811 RepID=MGR1_EREGS|nr:AFR719Wp [Eremothecium gossypii ATCC 10895]Q751V6.1 RecName: Full=Mitochondrial inner membrane i-AAA protease complex subunit MGR1 [Eremothecium gossypii ATCC 10895]AAS54091.1 AFR719Wp [Eremothecium gossypii ATCC 10895]AEY98406.1 FAFR719Wp [Eremothecium gossypii FDAG1]